MKVSGKILAIAGLTIAVLAVVALPLMAQDATVNPPTGSANGTYPLNTITVTGTGTASASPDMATVQVGVDIFNASVTEGFAEANTKIKAIVDALVAEGIAMEDISTSNLNVNSTMDPNGNGVNGYMVSNTVQVKVRDISGVSAVIDAAINAGATSLYGLSFDLDDRSPLESQARADAVKDATARAQEYATLIGATLGNVIMISENTVGGVIPYAAYDMKAAVGGAFVAPGQTEVDMQVQVTFQIVR